MASVTTTKATTMFTHLLLLLCFDSCLLVRPSDSFSQMASKQSNALWSNISKQLIVDTSRRRKTYASSSLRPSVKTASSSLLSSPSSSSGNPLRPSPDGEHQELSFHGKSHEEIKKLSSTPGARDQLRKLHAHQDQRQHHQMEQQQHRRALLPSERRPNHRRHLRKRHRHVKPFVDKSASDKKNVDTRLQSMLTTPSINAGYASSLPFPFPEARTNPAYDHTPANPLYTNHRDNHIYDHNGGTSSRDMLSHASVIYSNPVRQAVSPPTNNCCIRKIKFQNIGYDTYGRPVEVDVGECSRQCPYKKSGAPPGLSSFIPPPFVSESSGMKPRFLFGGVGGGDHGGRYRRQADNPERRDQATCDAHSGCFPTRKKMERWHLLGGLVEAEVIDECACSPPPDACMRMPLIKIFHPNSPYERRVDVGKCGGTCYDSNTRCNAIANTTVSIDTPNGERSIPVISQCGCTKTCYRASYKEVYYEAMYNKSSRHMERHVKEIDVGTCVGGCEGVKRQKCVLRDEKDPSICLMSLIKRQTSCIPTSYEKHEFLTPNMDLKTVVAIRNCGCK